VNQVDVVDDVHVKAVYQDGEAHDFVDEEGHPCAKFTIEPAEIQHIREIVSYSLNLVLAWAFACHENRLVVIVNVVEILEELNDLGEAHTAQIGQTHSKRISVVIGHHNQSEER
jgi:hypothetical protein